MKIKIIVMAVASIFLMTACKKNEKIESITCSKSDITTNSVVLYSNINGSTDYGGMCAQGFVISNHYSEIENLEWEFPRSPGFGSYFKFKGNTMNCSSCYIDGSYELKENLSDFDFAYSSRHNWVIQYSDSIRISNLVGNTKYYVRSFLVLENDNSSFFSDIVEFTSDKYREIVMEKDISVSNITMNSAKLSASIFSEGIPAYTERGFCYDFNTVTSLTVSNNKEIVQGTGEGDFGVTLTGLKNGRRYKVRGYATNVYGTVYTPIFEFRTIPSNILLNDGLIAHYNFNNENGKESQNIDFYDGIVQGSPTFSNDTPDGSGKSFLGGGGFFYITNNPFKEITDFTMSFWTKTMDPNSHFFYCSEGNNRLSVRLDKGFIRVYDGSSSWDDNKGKFDIPITNIILDDKWHQIVITRKKQGNNFNYKLYIDGVNYRQFTESDNITKDIPMFLGRDLVGNFDNLRIYERVLTQQEINTLFNAKQ